MPDNRLKLSARDPDDLAVIAACVQDALAPIGEMAYLPAEHRFVVALNRFRWERLDAGALVRAGADRSPQRQRGDAAFLEPGDGRPSYERVHSGLRFESVTAVRTKNIDLRNRERILALLTIQAEPGSVTLVFADDAVIRLEVADLRCYLEDFSDPWPTRWLPCHPDDAAGSKQQ
ncbi:MAG TPA: DUF2948 family protein [Candidatus Acidoferrum sp.]|nr:DUF2948 family protein [Candidatus Acidoferrum sp.]